MLEPYIGCYVEGRVLVTDHWVCHQYGGKNIFFSRPEWRKMMQEVAAWKRTLARLQRVRKPPKIHHYDPRDRDYMREYMSRKRAERRLAGLYDKKKRY